MPGVRGKTNNPNGRPPKQYALTNLLVKALNRPVEVNGKRISGKRVLASLVAKALTTGRLRFPDDTQDSVISVKDWIDFTRWAYQYLEPPITPHEITLPQMSVKGFIGISPEDWDKPDA